MGDYTFLHQLNIGIHVTTGTAALLLGVVALLSKKGGRVHKRSGLIFLFFIALVIVTALMGVLAFGANEFLIALTMLSGYQAFSGYRVLKSKSNKPKTLDILVALLTLSSGLYFLYYLDAIGMIWSPMIIYSTVGALFIIIAYDFLRYLFKAEHYKNFWLYEHIYKMIAAFTALLAAFIGTVLPQYHPYSQFLPSIFGTLLAIGSILYFRLKKT
ncbi:hypothetical protein [Ulvibacterium sp.]|uniref:hypothetical protein n=1 Tax=Ulvibacterium sp. TaxID=2665914 RepID=UPI00262F8C11|nr:hypothetical protein [Ulvibacterium sp.]